MSRSRSTSRNQFSRLERTRLISRRIWIAFFGGWVLMLSGFLHELGSPPGIQQAVTLGNLLRDRQERLAELEHEIQDLQSQRAALESSEWAQEREVRSRLGYLAPDEIIFEQP